MGEAAKIVVEGQDFVHAVLQRQGNQMGVVHQVSRDPAPCKDLPQDGVVSRRLRQDTRRRRLQEIEQRLQRFLDTGGGIEHPMMGDDAKELVQAGPEKGVRDPPLAQSPHQLDGGLVMLRALAVSIDQNIGVDPDHLSAPVQEIEQLVAVVEIHPGHDAARHSLQFENVSGAPALAPQGQALPQGFVDDLPQAAVLARGLAPRHLQNIIVERQSGSHKHHDATRGHGKASACPWENSPLRLEDSKKLDGHLDASS